MNCDPASDEIFSRTPKRAIQPGMRACTHSGVVMPRRGITSDQRVLRSIIVRGYVKLEEKSKGPTISMFMSENLFSGTEQCSSGAFVCFCTFEL